MKKIQRWHDNELTFELKSSSSDGIGVKSTFGRYKSKFFEISRQSVDNGIENISSRFDCGFGFGLMLFTSTRSTMGS